MGIGGKNGEEFCSTSAKQRYEFYETHFKEAHGEESDPMSQDPDPMVVMRAGPGKRSGRHLICNGAFSTSSHPKLSQMRAQSTSSSPSIRSRPTAQSAEISKLKTALEASEAARAKAMAEQEERLQAEVAAREKQAAE